MVTGSDTTHRQNSPLSRPALQYAYERVEEIFLGLVEKAEMGAPGHVSDHVDSAVAHVRDHDDDLRMLARLPRQRGVDGTIAAPLVRARCAFSVHASVRERQNALRSAVAAPDYRRLLVRALRDESRCRTRPAEPAAAKDRQRRSTPGEVGPICAATTTTNRRRLSRSFPSRQRSTADPPAGRSTYQWHSHAAVLRSRSATGGNRS
jgi:hypothetical protein